MNTLSCLNTYKTVLQLLYKNEFMKKILVKEFDKTSGIISHEENHELQQEKYRDFHGTFDDSHDQEMLSIDFLI